MIGCLMRAFPRLCTVLPLLAAVLASAGCENSATLPEPDPLTQSYLIFTGPLDPNGRNVYLLTLDAPVIVQVTLAGTVVENPFRSVSPVLQVEIGTFDGTECSVLESAETAPKFSAAVHRYMVGGTHCVAVSDKRGMAQQVGVVLRVDAPPVTGLLGTPGSASFTSTITPSGKATRTFDATTAGVATVTLSSLTPSNAEVGIGIGLHDPNGTGCHFAVTTTTRAGTTPQLSAPVSSGLYCFGLYDIGNFTGNQTFTLSATYP